jgi:starch synthase (maltosyl-transferring)
VTRFDDGACGYTRKLATHQEKVLERAIRGAEQGPSIAIEGVRPDVDCGQYAVKRVVGDTVTVEADVFSHGHVELAVQLEYRHEHGRGWKTTAMRAHDNDRWKGSFPVDRLGTYRFRIVAWFDDVATWRRDFAKKVAAGVATDLDREEGASLAEQHAKRANSRDRATLETWAERLRAGADRKALDQLDRLVLAARRSVDAALATVFDATSPVCVDRPLARCSAWYELFPRSASADTARPGTLADVARRLPYIAEMGFDVLYLPPIHPIGVTNRKGRNNTTKAHASDPGSPWAIGSAEGGHTAVHPELGTLADFDVLVETARAHDIEIALDIAFQTSPDHPWVREHPDWFRHRPDGSIAYAENPPKRYEDIYPLDFTTEDRAGLWNALLEVVQFWIQHEVRVFRVDNPHTKPFEFWEWLIATVHTTDPDVIFLSEAFTRPRVMERLAKIGFTQSYTYFTWRNEKWELEEYFRELTAPEHLDYFRPNVWPNTPDILHATLQEGTRATFIARFLLAAGLSANYGIYGPVYELQERTAREAGSEEYLDSEKYEIRHWNLDRPDSLRHLIRRVNAIRREHPALQRDDTLRFHGVDNDMIVCWSKRTPNPDSADGPGDAGDGDVVLFVVNLDPMHVQSGWTALDLGALGVGDGDHFAVHDLLTDARYHWQGPNNFVALDPATVPAHVLAVHVEGRTGSAL